MNRREVLKWTGAVSLLVAGGVPVSAAPIYRRIAVSRDGGPFLEREFETLIHGDRFRIIAPAVAVDGLIHTCHGAAQPTPGEPGNWGVMVSMTEGFAPPRPGDDGLDT